MCHAPTWRAEAPDDLGDARTYPNPAAGVKPCRNPTLVTAVLHLRKNPLWTPALEPLAGSRRTPYARRRSRRCGPRLAAVGQSGGRSLPGGAVYHGEDPNHLSYAKPRQRPVCPDRDGVRDVLADMRALPYAASRSTPRLIDQCRSRLHYGDRSGSDHLARCTMNECKAAPATVHRAALALPPGSRPRPTGPTSRRLRRARARRLHRAQGFASYPSRPTPPAACFSPCRAGYRAPAAGTSRGARIRRAAGEALIRELPRRPQHGRLGVVSASPATATPRPSAGGYRRLARRARLIASWRRTVRRPSPARRVHIGVSLVRLGTAAPARTTSPKSRRRRARAFPR